MIALIGNGTREVTFNQSTLIKTELDVVGSRNSLDAFQPMVQLLQGKAVNSTPIRTSVRPFAQTINPCKTYENTPTETSRSSSI